MNLLDLMVKIGVNDQASGQVGGIAQSITGKLGGALANVGKIMAGVGAAAGAGAIVMAKAVTDAYASYEQLAGGAQMIFSSIDYGKISADAQAAYLNMGISANQYLEAINQVGAAFKANMGDEAGYETAKKGMQAISDYASGTGRSVDELNEKYALITRSTSSYQSIADQFSGILPATSKDFLEQAQAAGFLSDKYKSLTEVPIAEYQQAVTNMLGKGVDALNLTGNTAREAMHTISGSVGAARASWTNLLTAIGSGDTDMINQSVTGLVDSIFGTFKEETGKREGGLINNIMPVLGNIAAAVRDNLPSIVSTVVDSAVNLINDTFGTNFSADDIIAKFKQVGETISNVAGSAFEFLSEHGDELASAFGKAVDTFGLVADAIGKVVDAIGPFLPMILGAVGALALMQPVIGIITAVSGAFTFLTTVILPALGMVQSFGGAIALVTTLLGGPIPILVAVGGAIAAFIATNEGAREAIVNAWDAVVQFFSGIPAWWDSVWVMVVDTVKGAVSDAIAKWVELREQASQIWEGVKTMVTTKALQLVASVVNKFNELKANAVAKFNEIKANITSAVQNARDTAINAFQRLKDGVGEKVEGVLGFVRSLPSKIKSALGNLGSLLWNAGSSIISGLLSGMQSAIGGVFSWVSGIAGNIARLKGPLPYDRKVLIDNGMALMYGLQRGLQGGFESKVEPYVKGLAGEVSSGMAFTASVNAGGAGRNAPQLNLTIGSLTVRNRDDADYFAGRINDIWKHEIEGSLA